jgi:ABC-2 type transport system ATP-binding protein
MPTLAAMDDASVSVVALTRDFGAVRALDDLSFEVPHGQVAGLLGHNGAGKTTAIRILNGLLAATRGSARVLGMDPGRDGATIRARTGVLTETPALDERLTARENLAYAARIFGVPDREARTRVESLLERFELAGRGADRAAGFSRGMKQRLALARALVHDPELLFLDEPTAALDPVAARDVHALIRDSARGEGRTVVVTTHNLVEAQRLCDRVVILRRGRAIADGSPGELSGRLAGSGGVEVEVSPGEVDAAAEVVRSALEEAVVETDGAILRVAGVGRERTPALVASLPRADVPVFRVSPREPTLEDVYFALHEEGPA